MALSIVKVPDDTTMDYDYIAFSFNGYHSYEDFGIIRTSSGDRYDMKLAPVMKDNTLETPGSDGIHYLGTDHKQKEFNISFAFADLPEEKINALKKWLNGKDMGDLWFAEEPYKVYTAKVTGVPNLKFLAFDKDGQRKYSGEGTVTFTAYWPYAHTPDLVQKRDGKTLPGNHFANYQEFQNYSKIQHLLPHSSVKPYGDLPFHFVATLEGPGSNTSTTIMVDDNGASLEINDPTATLNNGIYTIGE